MKKKFLYNIFLLILGATLWMSNSLGRAAAANSNSTTTGCGGGGCHQGGTYQGKITFSITQNGQPINKYSPGVTYDVSINVEKTGGTGTPAGYGFQLTASKSNKDAGVFSNFSTNVQKSSLASGRTFIEHDLKVTTGASTMRWTAPAAGTGTVTFYMAGNLVDGKNGQAGDNPIAPITVQLQEGSVAASQLPEWVSAFQISPNPLEAHSQITVDSQQDGEATVSIYDLQGRLVQQKEVLLNIGLNNISLTTEALAQTTYLVVLKKGTHTIVRKVVKW